MTFDEKVEKLTQQIVEGGWTSVYHLVSDLSEDDLNYRLELVSCAICGDEFGVNEVDDFDRCYSCREDEDNRIQEYKNNK